MLEGPLVFVDIDTQRDFLEPSGALYVPTSREILPNLHRLTHFAQTHAILILATACNHSLEDPNSVDSLRIAWREPMASNGLRRQCAPIP